MTISRFRHTQSVPARNDRHFINVNPSGAIWDCSNMIACNDRFLAVPWAQLGSTAVLRHTDYGKVASSPPILWGQEGPVIDVAFNPFDPTKLFTASEDGTIMGWDIPEEGLIQSTSDHIVHLQGHTKKVGIVNFHPSAMNVLASAGADMVVNVWDVNTGKAGEVLKCHTDQIMSLEWNLDGSLLCSTSKDKKVNIMDPRIGDIVASGSAHQGGKTQRCLWAKRQNLIVTVGFSKAQSRQVMLWDARDMASPVHTEDIDQFSSLILPFFDEDTNILYIGGRGDGIIRFLNWRMDDLCRALPTTLWRRIKGSACSLNGPWTHDSVRLRVFTRSRLVPFTPSKCFSHVDWRIANCRSMCTLPPLQTCPP
ncbi:Coronin-1A [Trypanosoma cruzi Dm28c]|uniref:Coronin n=1 Tax=Trypanosoma cruzi Dm28c TaxID=1416333 RepID=V5DFK6_TRYCR|nr:Coronin-1A [Trypanosoma cruzi Dm28c]